jgi:soluble lytic murein transglycosylase
MTCGGSTGIGLPSQPERISFMNMRFLPVCTFWLALGSLASLSMPARVDANDADRTGPSGNRTEFLAAAVSLAAGRMDDYARRRSALDDYVLAGYLDYAALRRDLRTLDPARARRFLDREGGSQLGTQFRREWLTELARRSDWKTFLAFDDSGDEGASAALRCLRLRARIAGPGRDPAREQTIRDELLALWPTGQSLPGACDDAIAYGRGKGWIDAQQTWLRLRLAVEAGNAGVAAHLAKQLPPGERGDGERLVQAISNPETTLQAATTWPDAERVREAVAWALRRRARQSVDTAIAHWQRLSPRFAFDDAQESAILRELALYAAVAYRSDAEDWFARVPASARDEQLAEWQLRAALAARKWQDVRDVANGLPAPLVDAPRPRYWRARALGELGQAQASREAFEALAGEANFHGFLAADRVGAPYSICPLETVRDANRAADLRNNIDIARAMELHAVGWRAEAGRAWDHGLRHAGEEDRLQALHLANDQGWHDRAVFALNSGENLRRYDLRFPVAERETVTRESAANAVDDAWVYALIRAESAWQPDARSHADAYGLMQLLPVTGRRMARELQLPWAGTGTLFDPSANIRLGTRYLSQQAARFGGSPWLASAAYNAGPGPVQRWLGERSSLPADIFIETIPYRETREYVTRVLAFSVIYDWRLYGKARPMSSRLPDPGHRYAGVPAPDSARPVVCAVPRTVAKTDPQRPVQ